MRAICDRYDVLLVSDDVICGFGRLGEYFGGQRYGYVPDILVRARGHVRRAPGGRGGGAGQPGHSPARGPQRARAGHTALFRSYLERLTDLPIVGDVRGDGYFFGLELVKEKATKQTFDDDESERLLRGFLSHALFDAGLYCRADDRGDPVVQLVPPLIAGEAQFAEIEQILRAVLTEAANRI